jgi:DNA-binding transcriptional LysR family regulator
MGDRAVAHIGDDLHVRRKPAPAAISSSFQTRSAPCRVRRWLVGAPSYFAHHDRPAHPRDLRNHACLGYILAGEQRGLALHRPDGAQESVAVKGPRSVTNAEALTAALEAGCGLVLQPDFLVWEAVRDGRVEIALKDWSVRELGLNLMTPPGWPRPARVSVVLDFLTRRFSAGAAPWVGR